MAAASTGDPGWGCRASKTASAMLCPLLSERGKFRNTPASRLPRPQASHLSRMCTASLRCPPSPPHPGPAHLDLTAPSWASVPSLDPSSCPGCRPRNPSCSPCSHIMPALHCSGAHTQTSAREVGCIETGGTSWGEEASTGADPGILKENPLPQPSPWRKAGAELCSRMHEQRADREQRGGRGLCLRAGSRAAHKDFQAAAR